MSSKPLATITGIHSLNPNEDVGYFNGKKSKRTFHIFVNSLDEPVDLYYFYDGGEMHRGCIEPGSNLYVGTYIFHQWKVKRQGDGALLGLYAGQSAIVTIHSRGCSATYNPGTVDWRDVGDADRTTSMPTPNGSYDKRSTVQGMEIWALQHVSDAAVERLKGLVNCMLQACPVGVLKRMLQHYPSFGIFGRDNVVSDLPPHAFMRFNTNRDLDKSSRGLGATPTVPVTSCGEENLTMDNDKFYPCQSIFVHEFGHAVMNLGMPTDTRQRLQEAYQAAVDEGTYPHGCYIIVNEHEYFATATEAWFESTIRKDVNGGLNTRDLVKSRDPRLASIMAEMFGDGMWRFHHNCPRQLSFYRSTSKSKAAKIDQSQKSERSSGPVKADRDSIAAAAEAGWQAQVQAQLLSHPGAAVSSEQSQRQLERARQQQQVEAQIQQQQTYNTQVLQQQQRRTQQQQQQTTQQQHTGAQQQQQQSRTQVLQQARTLQQVESQMQQAVDTQVLNQQQQTLNTRVLRQLGAQQQQHIGVQAQNHAQHAQQQQHQIDTQMHRSQTSQQQQQQQQHQPLLDMQPPLHVNLLEHEHFDDAQAEAESGESGGNGGLLSWLLPVLPCMPLLTPSKRPQPSDSPSPQQQHPSLSPLHSNLQQQPMGQPQLMSHQQQQPIAQLQQQPMGYRQQQPMTHLQQDPIAHPQLVGHPQQQQPQTQAEYEVAYAAWEAECERKRIEHDAWERDHKQREVLQLRYERDRVQWERQYGNGNGLAS